MTVRALQDADDNHETVTVTHRASDPNYLPGRLQIEVRDPDHPTFGSLTAEFHYPANPVRNPPGVHFGEPFDVWVRFFPHAMIGGTQGDARPRRLSNMIGPDRAIRVTGATVESAETIGGAHIAKLRIAPTGFGDVTLTLEPMPCDARGAVCSNTHGGLKERVTDTLRGIDRPPAAPRDVRAETVQIDGYENMRVTFAGTDDARTYRVQWKRDFQDWSQAREHSNWRNKAPGGRQWGVTKRVEPALHYDVRARWENPSGAGPWTYTTRAGLPVAQWGETLSWRKAGGRNEVYIHYIRDLDRKSRLDRAQHLYDVEFSGSPSSGFAVDEISIIDDDQGRPRVVKLTLADGFDPHYGARLWVIYTQSQVAGPRPPGVLDQQRNRAPSFPRLEATYVRGPDAPALSVGDTTVREAPGAMAHFPVTLRPAASEEVTVEYETYPVGSATPGEDYAHTTGTLTFDAGQTARTISVPVHDDDHEDSGETFRLMLDRPRGGIAYIADAWAVATITNDDPAPESTGPPALTAKFVSVPKGHLGSPFTFELRFSEEVSLDQQAITGGDAQQSVLSVAGGAVTGASRIDEGESRGWNVTVTPSGKGNVVINLPATTNCGAGTAVCTADSRPLSAAIRTTVIGLLPPVPELATIPPAGDQLQLFFDRSYDNRTYRRPPSNAFVVNADGVQHVVSGVETSVSNRWLRLSFTPPVKEHQAVTVSYRDPTEGNDRAALQLRSGEDADSFSGFAVTNNSTVQDPVAPAPAGPARLNTAGDEISLGFTRAIDPEDLPATSAFAVTVDGTQATVSGVRVSRSDPNAIVLDVTPAISASAQAVTVTYSDPTAGDDEQALQNRSGVDAESFDRSVHRATQTATETGTSQPEPLTAEFWKLPTTHGSLPFKFELVFSDEPFSLSYARFIGSDGQSSVLSVANGEVTAARRLVQGKNQSWEVAIAPAGDEDVTISLPASADCASENAICTADARPLSAAVAATVLSALPDPPPPTPVTATIEDAPQVHGGAPFVLRVRFSEPASVTWAAMLDGILSVTNGRVTGARRIEQGGDSNVLWEVDIEPGPFDVTVEVLATEDCAAAGAVCTEDGRKLAAASVTVPAGELPSLTATQPAYPATHDRTEFDLELTFNWPILALYAKAFAVTGAEIVDIARLEADNARWRLRVLPLSNAAVRVALPATTDCAAAWAVCTEDGRKLSHALAWEIAPADPDAVDGAAPAPVEAEARLAALTLVWSEGLDESSVPAADAFAVTVAGRARALAATDPVRVSGRRVFLTLASTAHPGEAVAVSYTPPAENPIRDLAANAAAAVSGFAAVNASPELQAWFAEDGRPASHDGVTPLRFEIVFSEAPVDITWTKLRLHALKLLLGTRTMKLKGAMPVDPADPKRWKIDVEFRRSDAELAHEGLTVAIEPTRDCSDAAALCTPDGRKLSERISMTIPGVAAVSAVDAAEAGEADGALAFAVRLNRAREEAVTVDYATADGTAAAGADYEAASGTLTFAPGQTERRVLGSGARRRGAGGG